MRDQRRCWAPWPLRPIVGQQGVCEFVYGLAAVSPLDDQLAWLILPWVDADAMSLFLAHTAAQFPNKHCLMLLDGAGWHTSPITRAADHPTTFLAPLQPGIQSRGTPLGIPAGKLHQQPGLRLAGRLSSSNSAQAFTLSIASPRWSSA